MKTNRNDPVKSDVIIDNKESVKKDFSLGRNFFIKYWRHGMSKRESFDISYRYLKKLQ